MTRRDPTDARAEKYCRNLVPLLTDYSSAVEISLKHGFDTDIISADFLSDPAGLCEGSLQCKHRFGGFLSHSVRCLIKLLRSY